MKYLLIGLLLVFSCAVSAQIVNIPDPAFKAYLVAYNSNFNGYLDANGDGEIQLSEALAFTELAVVGGFNTDISDMTGIRSFANLQTLSIESLNLLTNLDVSGLTNLVTLDCRNNSLSQLNLTGCNNLRILNCTNNLLTSIDLTALPNIREARCDDNLLTSINLDGLHHLNFFSCDHQQSTINELTARNCDSLGMIYCSTTSIETLDISGSTMFDNIHTVVPIRNTIARNCTGLTVLDLTGTDFFQSNANLVDVSGCTNLHSISINDYNFTNLDLSSCTNLQDLSLNTFGHGLTNLNIKNGSITQLSLSSNYPLNTLNICADDFEIDGLWASLSNYGLYSTASANISSTCSFFPGGSYNTIKGKIRLDLNNNGCDNADAGMNFVPVKITDDTGSAVVRYTYSNGNYAHYPYIGNFTVQPYFPYPWFDVSPVSANIGFTTASSLMDSADFCISPNGAHNDVTVTLLPIMPARPGFPATYGLVYKNTGTTTQSGNIQLNYDNSKLTFTNTSVPVGSQTPGQLVWSYSNLQPFETRSITLLFGVLPPPVNNVGDTIFFLASISPIVNDETPGNNSFTFPQGLRGSYDPNDKECLHDTHIDIASIDKPLDYIIRFQNLGTDTAFNVVIIDTLTNNFDWESFDFTSSSHACDVQRKGNKLQFYFRDIHLSYAAINEPASHGFVAFKIKPKNTVVIGDSLNNKASIYFDFNLPVVTNIATTVVSPASPVPVKLEYFSLSKKNETHLLTWKAPSTDAVTTFDIERSTDGIHFTNIGNITATSQRCQLPFNFTDDKPLAGKNYYRLKITGDNEIYFYSKILVIGNNKDGFEIIAITNSDNNTIMYFNSAKQQTIQMKLVAVDGKIIYKDSKTILAGSGSIYLSLKNIAKGGYTMIAYTNEGGTITKRFVK